MALNLYRKINESIARNCIRFFRNNSQKLAQTSVLKENTQVKKDVEKQDNFNKYAISSNCRTTPTENPRLWANSFQPEREIVKRHFQNSYLQPATMPSFKDEPIFDKNFMATLQEEPIKRAQTIALNNSASQQILESFKKKQAQNLPTRVPKPMSNPFPEPLKPILSPFTFSDQEKADQMFQEQQPIQFNSGPSKKSSSITDGIKSSKKFYCTSSLQGVTSIPRQNGWDASRPFVKGIVRLFSRKSDCGGGAKDEKKPKSCVPKKCNKMTIRGCPPVRPNTICKQKNKEVVCKKVDAPYPSYSESCYMEPKQRQRECEMCPWTVKNNPNFKGKLKIPPKFYHTQCLPTTHTKTVTGSILGNNITGQEEHKNAAQMWIHKANMSQIYTSGKKMPDVIGLLDSARTSKIARWPFNLRKNNDLPEENDVRTPINTEMLTFTDYDRHHSVLAEFFMKNEDLMNNFQNGDDLSDFGIKKATLSKELCRREMSDIVCKKGKRLIPDYPKDCDRPYQDTSKTCPSGLTRKKTKKDRLKRKLPKDQSCR